MVRDEMIGLYTEERSLVCTVGVGVRHKRVANGWRRGTKGHWIYLSIWPFQYS